MSQPLGSAHRLTQISTVAALCLLIACHSKRATPKPAPIIAPAEAGTVPQPSLAPHGDPPTLPLDPNNGAVNILVMPLHAESDLGPQASALDELILTALGHLHHYQVLGPEDINALLGVDKMKDAVGCDNVSCAAQLGGALNAEYLVAGKLTRLGHEAVLSLRLLDTKNSRILARGSARGLVSADGLAAMSGEAVNDLLNMKIAQVRDVSADNGNALQGTVATAAPAGRQALDSQLAAINESAKAGKIGDDQALELSTQAAITALAWGRANNFLYMLMQRAGSNDARWYAFAVTRVQVLEHMGNREEARRVCVRARDRNGKLFKAKGLQEVLTRLGG